LDVLVLAVAGEDYLDIFGDVAESRFAGILYVDPVAVLVVFG